MKHNNDNKSTSEHLRAEVESLRSMLNRWFSISKNEISEKLADSSDPEIEMREKESGDK